MEKGNENIDTLDTNLDANESTASTFSAEEKRKTGEQLTNKLGDLDGPGDKDKDEPETSIDKIIEDLTEQSTKVANYYLRKGYTFSKVSPIQPGFFTQLEKQRQTYQGDDYYKQVDENQFYQREFETKTLDLNAPMNLFDKRKVPVAIVTLNNIDTQAFANGESKSDAVDIYIYNAAILEKYAPELFTPKQGEGIVGASKSSEFANGKLEINGETVTDRIIYDGYLEFKKDNMVPLFIGSENGGLPKGDSEYTNISWSFYKNEVYPYL